MAGPIGKHLSDKARQAIIAAIIASPETPASEIAKAFGVKRGTIYRWLTVYEEEKKT